MDNEILKTIKFFVALGIFIFKDVQAAEAFTKADSFIIEAQRLDAIPKKLD